jgi:type IV pilus assembly protein PilO
MASLPRIDLTGYLANVPARKKVLFGAVLVVLASVGYWHFFLKGAWQERSRAEAELARVKAEAEQTRRVAAQRPALEHEVQLLQARLNRALLQLPEEKEIPSLLTRIARLGRETDLEVSLFKPGNPVAKEFYSELPIQLKVLGTYHNLGTLFERLGRLDRIINVGDVSIRPAGKDQRPGASILAEFGLVTYTYTASRGAKAGDAKPAQATKKRT